MAGSLLGKRFFDNLAAEHRTWLSAFDPQHLANWEKVLNADQESALAEAGVRRLLQRYGTRVEPNEDLTGSEQRPDFRCESNGSTFEVEVTRISIAKTTKITGLAEDAITNVAEEPVIFEDIRPLNDAVFVACKGKARQCGDAPHPTLLAVATFHYGAAVFCLDKSEISELLTGRTRMRLSLGGPSAERPGEAYLITDLHSAAFLQFDGSRQVGFARSSISGLIMCGLGADPPQVIGVLHPNPARRFAPTLLPEIEFGQVTVDWATSKMLVNWPRGDKE